MHATCYVDVCSFEGELYFSGPNENGRNIIQFHTYVHRTIIYAYINTHVNTLTYSWCKLTGTGCGCFAHDSHITYIVRYLIHLHINANFAIQFERKIVVPDNSLAFISLSIFVIHFSSEKKLEFEAGSAMGFVNVWSLTYMLELHEIHGRH